VLNKTETTQSASEGSFLKTIKNYFEEIQQNRNTRKKASAKINYQRVERELQQFILKLKEILPYHAYKKLLDETDNFRDKDKMYSYLIELSREHNVDLSINFPELNKLLKQIESEQNPAEIDERYNKEVEEMSKEITPGREDEFIEKALVEMRARNYREALKIYDAVVKANPDNKRVWMNRGTAKSGLKDYDGAIADTTRSIEINPTRYTAYSNRAMYYNERALNKHRQEDFYKALDDINTYIEAGRFNEKDRNTEVETYILKGEVLARLGQYNEAIKTLKYIEPKYINEGQKNEEFYSWIGWSYQMSGDDEKAKEYYVKSGSKYAKERLNNLENRKTPDKNNKMFSDCAENLGENFKQSGEYKERASIAEQLKKSSNYFEEVQGYLVQSWADAAAGDYQKVIKETTEGLKILERNKNSAVKSKGWADINGRREGVVRSREQAAMYFYSRRGNANVNLGNSEAAAEDFKKIQELKARRNAR